jgi:dihydrofolate synthase/folylpolyglutamate synthase
VLGVCADKDVEGIGANLFPLADKIIFTRAASPRAMPPDVLKEKAKGYTAGAETALNVADAISAALACAGRKDLVLITGSLYVVGEALKALSKKDVQYEKISDS